MKISDDQLLIWTKPGFDNETDKAEETKARVKTAIDKNPALRNLSLRVFPKGSYANNTNVRRDSDIDIAVEYEGLISLSFAEGVRFPHTGLNLYTGISEREFKSFLYSALRNEFGDSVVDGSGNKVFKIRGSSRILNADVIPCTTFRYYYAAHPDSYRQGVQLILNRPDGKIHYNYPDQHLRNGIDKNNIVQKRYKSAVRILKNAKNFLVSQNTIPDYYSFMIECLAYNVSGDGYLQGSSWREIVINACIDIWQYSKEVEPIESRLRWTEVNNYKYLFHGHQRWTQNDAKEFSAAIFNLLNI